jgi:sugar phosphate isomerase/epimerase
MTGLERFSLNLATTRQWPLPDAVAGCAAAGIAGVGLWRDQVAPGVADLVRSAGLRVTSLCRGGFLTGEPAIADNRAAIDEAAALGTDVLVMVSGGLPPGSRDVDAARERVADGLAELVPYARSAGVRLAVEPLHPMFCADRCVVSTLDQALNLAEHFPADVVGVVVDAYHVWWDPGVYRAIARAAGRILSFQVCDWVTPLPAGVLEGRGMMGDGCIELSRLRAAVDATGYTGPIEVEIFNAELAQRPGPEVLALAIERYQTNVL